jgi:uncharacterized membrane protein YhaH (DUF805 family)
MKWTTLFLSPEGRIGQKDYWLGVIVLSIADAVVQYAGGIGAALWLVSTYAWICVCAKRLHDLGHSGWLQIAPWIVSLVCLALGGAAFMGTLMGAAVSGYLDRHLLLGLGTMIGGVGASLMLLLAAATANLVFLLWLGLSRGQAGANRFG